MNRTNRRLVTHLSPLIVVAALAACGDNNIGINQSPDAGPLPTVPDAATPMDPDAAVPPENLMIECPEKGDFPDARAHWISADTIAWPTGTTGVSYEMAYADCQLRTDGTALIGAEATVALTEDLAGLSAEQAARFPHLSDYRALKLDAGSLAQVPELLGKQFVLVEKDDTGAVIATTRVQIPGVVDDLFTYDGELGVSFDNNKATFQLWAPTARWVALHVYDRDTREQIAVMNMAPQDRGVWSLTEPEDQAWYGHYFQYEVYVFVPNEREYAANRVTDPYSVGLSENSDMSLLIDLDDPATKPDGWEQLTKPPLDAPEDIAIYEVHIRDFSAIDNSVPVEHRGKYMAFTYNGSNAQQVLSNGMNHLRQLAAAGLTHIHLLPAFDIATIEETATARVEITDLFDDLCNATSSVPVQECTMYTGQTITSVLESLDPSTGDAQRIVSYMYELDGFNWGYDPYHYTTPEGSYATSGDGAARIIEFRAMVQALAASGLRVAMDVVYNHTNSSGQNAKSVLDRVVPGYYHRLNQDSGEVERSTCCENTASEHAMMEKLMIDSLVVWARDYKVDSFRFDLMGHHMKTNMIKARDAIQTLTVGADGVDGSKIYLYGEGWNFGEVVSGTRGENATQLTMGGTGIGTFSDRLRDAVRGGGPFDNGNTLREAQGFVNGKFYDPNEMNSGSPAERDGLLLQADQIRVGMAGNLRDFVLVDRAGNAVQGQNISYHGSPAGYTDDPQEVITYITAHDNQTLWDINQYKIPTGTDMATRVRIQNLGLSIVALSQGIPFMHMGGDILRSKSMERDSYNSGDFYNRTDFTYQSNNWNIGLPREDKDGSNWDLIRQIISDTSIAPQQPHIVATAIHYREMLRIRKSSVLFRLRTRDDVATRVNFHNTGPSQIPGLIVMTVTDGTCAGADLDPALDAALVFVNASDAQQTFTIAGATGFALHGVQQTSADIVVQGASFDGTDQFTIPARTTAVFVQAQGASQGTGLPCNDLVPVNVLNGDVYIRGTMNGWTAPVESRFTQDPNTESLYTVDLMLAADTYLFKVADDQWTTYNWGIPGGNITPGDGTHQLSSGGGDDITLNIAATGVYRFTLDTSGGLVNPVLSVDPAP